MFALLDVAFVGLFADLIDIVELRLGVSQQSELNFMCEIENESATVRKVERLVLHINFSG